MNARLQTKLMLCITLSLGCCTLQAQSSPTMFAILQGDHGLGCCNNNFYTLSTGGSTQFVNPGETINASFTNTSAAFNLHIFEDGATTDGDGNRLDVYVLGPPGTPFRLQFTYFERDLAVNESSGAYLTAVIFQAFQDISVSASPGTSSQNSASGGDTVVGVTSGQTVSFLGQTYSLAWSAGHLIEIGANTCCGSYTGHAEADLNITVALVSNCTFTISPSTATANVLGDSGSILITASQPSCSWTATSNGPWLTITSGGSGVGSGAVAYSAAANFNDSARQGTITIGGQVFTLSQPGLIISLDVPPQVRPSFVPAPPSFNPSPLTGTRNIITANATLKDTTGQLVQSPLQIDFSIVPDADGMHAAGHCHTNIDVLSDFLILVDDNDSPTKLCQTGQDGPGQCHLKWLVDDTSGLFKITASLDANPTIADTQSVSVAIGGLTSLATNLPSDKCVRDGGTGVGYILVGEFGTDHVPSVHYQNHFGSPRLIAAIKTLAGRYSSIAGETLKINDMSLPLGGLFDIGNGWVEPHALHRDGNSVDINLEHADGSSVNRPLLTKLAWYLGMCPVSESTIHFDFLIHSCK